MKIKKNDGSHSKGHMFYINDSTFQLKNERKSTNDTIKISEIEAVRSPSLLNKIIAYPCYIAGSGFSFLGMILLIGDGSNDPISEAYGAMSLGLSAPLLIIGSKLKRGRNFKSSSYRMKFIASKKKNLNRRKIHRMGFTCDTI